MAFQLLGNTPSVASRLHEVAITEGVFFLKNFKNLDNWK
jgi:hypothetical protein